MMTIALMICMVEVKEVCKKTDVVFSCVYKVMIYYYMVYYYTTNAMGRIFSPAKKRRLRLWQKEELEDRQDLK